MPVYRVNANQVLLDQVVMNVFHYEAPAGLGTAEADIIADAFRAAWADADLIDQLVPAWAFNGITLRRVDIVDQPEIDGVAAAGQLVGTASGQPMPTQVALLLSGSAPTAFPRRVRTYLAGWYNGAATAGQFSAANLLAVLDWAAVVDSIQLNGDDALRVAVRYSDDGEGPYVSAYNRITSYKVVDVPATQRRRRIGVGV